MNRHERCSLFPRNSGSQRKAKNVTVQRFFIQNHASSQNYLSRSRGLRRVFEIWNAVVKLKHIACWIEILRFGFKHYILQKALKWFGPRTKSISTWFRLNEIAKVRTRWAELSIFRSFIAHRRNLFAFISILTITFPELQRNLKGFAFARLYREASDNESAKR